MNVRLERKYDEKDVRARENVRRERKYVAKQGTFVLFGSWTIAFQMIHLCFLSSIKKGFFLADSLHCLLTKELQVICVKTKKKKLVARPPKRVNL